MFSPHNLNFPRASNVALLEIGKSNEGFDREYDSQVVMNMAPRYLRMSEAEISKEERYKETK